MDVSLWHELVGYGASAVVVYSLMMKSILRLRLIGLVGAAAFLAYGVLIGSVPIVLTNAVILGIHLFYLRRLSRRSETFSILNVDPSSKYLERLLQFHARDIQVFQPGFEYQPVAATRPALILRDMIPAGVFIAVPHDDGSLEVQLDYATPQYRDFKLGRFVYSADSEIFGHPTCVWSDEWSDSHTAYLKRMGFEPAERAGRTVMQLPMGG